MAIYRVETIITTDNEEALKELVAEFASKLYASNEIQAYSPRLGVGLTRVADKPYRRGAYHAEGVICVDG